MGKCKYCNEDAGFFSSKHVACETKFKEGCNQMHSLLQDAFLKQTDFYLLDKQINQIVANYLIPVSELQNLYVSAFDKAIENYLEDGLISKEEKQCVARFQQYTNLPQDILNKNQSLEKVVQADILRSIMVGVIPTPAITISSPLPFMLQKNEKILWVFRNIQYHQQKTVKEYVGRSQGVSFRIMKGVYYRVGGFKGRPVEKTNTVFVSTGIVGVTDKHLYFSSPTKSFKIPYAKIIDLQPYSDGLGIQKDGASSQPMFLQGVNSWFVYNLITNITNNL